MKQNYNDQDWYFGRKKSLKDFWVFTTKHVFPNFSQQVLEGEGQGFQTLQCSNFKGSFSSESMELEKE